MPVRGHSNVQGDRTVGIDEKAPPALLDALEKELGVPMPRRRGHNTVEAVSAMLDGKAQAFIALGGNFMRATPDSPLIVKAFENQKLTVNIATKLNHSHLVPGETSFILPCLGRTEIDRNSSGRAQIVTVEDSMSMVHGSGGINSPASEALRSEVAIIAGIAEATLGNTAVDWKALADDYDLIRDMIERVIPALTTSMNASACRAASTCVTRRRSANGTHQRTRPPSIAALCPNRQNIKGAHARQSLCAADPA